MSYYYNAAGQRFPLPERPLEPPEEPGESWRNPSDRTLREYAEDRYADFIEYIAGYDKTLLLDFAMQNRMDFKEFVEG